MSPPSGPAAAGDFEREALVHLDSLYRTARRLSRSPGDAEDLVQETMLRAYRFFHQFQVGTNCRAWLMRILHNVHLNMLGREARKPPTSQIDGAEDQLHAHIVGELPGAALPPELEVLRHVWDDRVLEALDALPLEYRSVVVLCDIEEMAYKEVAEALEIPIGTVRSRLARGRRQLAVRLADMRPQKSESHCDLGP